MLTLNLLHTRAHVAAGLVRCRRCTALVLRLHRGWCQGCSTTAARAWRRADPVSHARHRAVDRQRHFARVMLHRAKARARQLGVPFDLTPLDITIPDACPVLGIALCRNAEGGFNDASPSLDRLIPALGYVRGNVVVISNRANILKKNATLAEIEALARWMRTVLA